MKKALFSKKLFILLICSLFMFCSPSSVLAATQVSDQSGNGHLNYEKTFELSESGKYVVILGGRTFGGQSIHYILSRREPNGTYKQIFYLETPTDGSSYFKVWSLNAGTYSIRISTGQSYYFAYNIYKQ